MSSNKTLSILMLAILVLMAAPVAAATSQYRVSADITVNGASYASPALLVKSGSVATVSMEGKKGYRFQVNLEHTKQGKLAVVVNFSTNKASVRTEVLAKLGKTLLVSQGDVGINLTVEAADNN